MAFDVDGVLTDGKLTYLPDGSETKTFYTLDGAGIRMLQKAGITVGWITGRSSPAVEHRARNLGITHLAQGVSDKARRLCHLARGSRVADLRRPVSWVTT